MEVLTETKMHSFLRHGVYNQCKNSPPRGSDTIRNTVSFQNNTRLVGRLGSGPSLVGRIGSEVRGSACFHNEPSEK